MVVVYYDKDIPKRKKFELEDFNDFFGTSYKKLSDVQRFILEPVKEELDLNSKITFLYEVNFIQLDKGRPKSHNITIDVVDNSKSLFAQ